MLNFNRPFNPIAIPTSGPTSRLASIGHLLLGAALLLVPSLSYSDLSKTRIPLHPILSHDRIQSLKDQEREWQGSRLLEGRPPTDQNDQNQMKRSFTNQPQRKSPLGESNRQSSNPTPGETISLTAAKAQPMSAGGVGGDQRLEQTVSKAPKEPMPESYPIFFK